MNLVDRAAGSSGPTYAKSPAAASGASASSPTRSTSVSGPNTAPGRCRSPQAPGSLPARRGAQPHPMVGRHRRRPAPRRLNAQAQRLAEYPAPTPRRSSRMPAPLPARACTKKGDTAVHPNRRPPQSVRRDASGIRASLSGFRRADENGNGRWPSRLHYGVCGGGLHHGGIRPPRRRAPRRNGGESRKPHRSGDGTLIHHLPPSASPALSLSKLHIATHIE